MNETYLSLVSINRTPDQNIGFLMLWCFSYVNLIMIYEEFNQKLLYDINDKINWFTKSLRLLGSMFDKDINMLEFQGFHKEVSQIKSLNANI